MCSSPRTVIPTEEKHKRRRRIEMRRRLVAGVGGRDVKRLAAAAPVEAEVVAPVYGLMSVVGRAREMEDEVTVQVDLCRPEINGFQPVHFFGVFDGHGGAHVSSLCKESMHVILAEELMRVNATTAARTTGETEELWKAAIRRSFERIDAMALSLCECNGIESSNICRFHPQLSVVGSTAVVALLTRDYIIVGNCGDSRAVLCRNGKAVPLSVDHKPDREDERARIEGLGGWVKFVANVARVEGMLAVSRAIGDRFLKQVVTSEPEIMFMKREKDDVSLVLASDGLWDVLSSELCCEIVHRCQQEEDVKGGLGMMTVGSGGPVYTMAAAALLVRLAMGRRSCDNVSVVVVDLKA